ncbi:MAG: NADH-quinone oxidoreductase subunit L, partial [Actinomycetota bacterium]
MKTAVVLIPLLPLASFIITGLLGRRYFKEKSHYLSVASVAVSWALSMYVFYRVERGGPATWQDYSWIVSGNFKVDVGFLVD